jgi:hypothetical protein
VLVRVGHYLLSLSGESLSPTTAALMLSNLQPCLPLIASIVRDLSRLMTEWTKAGGVSEMWSGVVTHLLPGVTCRQLRSHASPFIRSLAEVRRSEYPGTRAEVAVAAGRLDQYLGKWVPQEDWWLACDFVRVTWVFVMILFSHIAADIYPPYLPLLQYHSAYISVCSFQGLNWAAVVVLSSQESP